MEAFKICSDFVHVNGLWRVWSTIMEPACFVIYWNMNIIGVNRKVTCTGDLAPHSQFARMTLPLSLVAFRPQLTKYVNEENGTIMNWSQYESITVKRLMSTLSQLKHDIYYESKCKRVNYSIQNGRGRDNILSQSHGSGHFNVPGFWYRQKDRPSINNHNK